MVSAPNVLYVFFGYQYHAYYHQISPTLISGAVQNTNIYAILCHKCTSLSFQWRCELTPYSQRTHLNYLTVSSFWGHLVSSQLTHKMSSHWELAVSFPWVCISHNQLIAANAWWVIRWSHEYLTASSRCEFEVFSFSQWQTTNTFKQTNRKLSAISQCEVSGESTVR